MSEYVSIPAILQYGGQPPPDLSALQDPVTLWVLQVEQRQHGPAPAEARTPSALSDRPAALTDPNRDAITPVYPLEYALSIGALGLAAGTAGLAVTGGEAAAAAVGEAAASTAGEAAAAEGAGALKLGTAESWGNPSTLADHFARHGADFGATSEADYANQASQFLQRSQAEGLPTQIDANGGIRVYDPNTNTFGAYYANGTTKTFYQPSSPTYWSRQPGVAPTIFGGP